jgi:hypothetical protein
MDDGVTQASDELLTYWDQHRYLLLIASAIVVAIVLVTISMTLYNSSGAAQLDLSRPGYRAVSDQAVKSDADFQNFSAFGTLDQSSINEFKALYDTQSAKAKAVDAFGGDPLNPDVLEISAPSTTDQP